jgi:hypothetical protein
VQILADLASEAINWQNLPIQRPFSGIICPSSQGGKFQHLPFTLVQISVSYGVHECLGHCTPRVALSTNKHIYNSIGPAPPLPRHIKILFSLNYPFLREWVHSCPNYDNYVYPHSSSEGVYYVLSQAENGDEQMLGIVKFAPESMGLLKMHFRGLNLFLSFLLLGWWGGWGGGAMRS